MHPMRREIDDDLDFWIGQQVFNASGLFDIVLCSARLRSINADIANPYDVKGVELLAVLEIDAADRAASNETDLGG